MILIVGANGNMGKRYKAILRFLGKEYLGVDKEHNRHHIKEMAMRSDGVLIATPTELHTEHVRWLLPCGKPIMCEKPITKNIQELRALFDEIRSSNTPFRMINQYKMLDNRGGIGHTVYNYFKHGNDGLVWDCIQIIGIARSKLALGEDSPVWRCVLNGKGVSLSHMDAAYIAYMQEWFKNPAQDLGELLATHEKTADMERTQWNTRM